MPAVADRVRRTRPGSFVRRATALLRRDARLSQEPGRLRQARRHAARRRAWRPPTTPAPPTSSSSTRARSSTTPARSRSTPSSPSTSARRAGARLVVTGCMAERYGDELAAALPEVDQVAGFGVARAPRRPAPSGRKLIPVSSAPLPALDLLNLPRPQVDGAVGVRQDRRGLRPHVRVLRHPVVPRPAAQPRRRLDPRRGRRSSTPARSCSSPRTWRRTARTSPASSAPGAIVAARAGRGRPRRPGPAAVPLPERPHRRADRRDLRLPACRTSTSRCSTSASRCCAGCAAGATATASCGASPTSAPREPDAAFRSNFIVGYPGETEARPRRSCCAFVEEAQLDWCGFFAYSRRGRHVRRRPRRAGAGGADGRAAGRARASCRTPSRPAGRDELIGARRSRCSSTRRASAAATARRPRSTASCTSRHDLPVGDVRDGRDRRRPRARPRRRRRRLAVAGTDERLMPSNPSALATWANAITAGRLLLSPLMFLVIPEHDRGLVGRVRRCGSCCAPATASTATSPAATAPTRSGAFLDPLADKVLVLGAMFTLVGSDVFWIVPVAIIAAREFVISMYRTRRRLEGRVSMPASRLGQVQDAGPAARRRVRAAAVDRASTRRGCGTGLLWLAVVLAARQRRRSTCWRAHVARPEAAHGRLMRCDVAGRRHRAAARSDRRHQLVVDRRAAGGQRHRLAAPGQGRRQRRPDRRRRCATCSPTPTR